jgi:hypothetical protein
MATKRRKRRTSSNLQGSSSEHKNAAAEAVRMAQHAMKALAGTSSCKTAFHSIIDVERRLAVAGTHLHQLPGTTGKGQKSKLFTAIRNIGQRLEESELNFFKECNVAAKF